MDATVQKWGNSLALRIPRSLAKEVDLHQGSVVDVAVVEGKMVVKPKKVVKLSLARMLGEITKENRRSEQDWGRAKGKEAW
jgi:antitoxin MazE